jgi:hypothetical protein
MNPIGAGQAYSPTTVSVQAPIGKAPVGLESPQNKNAALPPIEESAAADKARAEQTADKAALTARRESNRNPSPAAAEPQQQAVDQAQVNELAGVDRQVRAHEAAHAAVAGALAGAKSFSYVTGPDGVRYAVAGEVSIEFGEVAGDAEATLRNANQVRAAALAPAQPSAQDFHVAALAGQIIAQAQIDVGTQRNTQPSAPNRQRSASAVRTFDEVQRDRPETPSRLDQRV